MYATTELKGKKVLIVCGAQGKEELTRVLKAMEINKEDIKFVTKQEMDEIAQTTIDKIKIEIQTLELTKLMEMPFIEPIKKPHFDRNIRRHSRKSRW